MTDSTKNDTTTSQAFNEQVADAQATGTRAEKLGWQRATNPEQRLLQRNTKNSSVNER